MWSPPTSRDRASGGSDLGDLSLLRVEKTDDTLAEEQSAARNALKTAEANMVAIVARAQDASSSPSMKDMRTAIIEYHAAQDRTKPLSYAGVVKGTAALPSETARAGAKRPSSVIERRLTGEGSRQPPVIRVGGGSATLPHVDGDVFGTLPANFSRQLSNFSQA